MAFYFLLIRLFVIWVYTQITTRMIDKKKQTNKKKLKKKTKRVYFFPLQLSVYFNIQIPKAAWVKR